MSDVLIQVGQRIREIRKEKGYSQNILAEKCGFTFSYIGGVERAEKNISLINLAKIAEGLDVGIHQFFIYSYEYEHLSDKEELIKELVSMLIDQNPDTIEMAKNILKEVIRYSQK
ncbi:helix-turn-helix domain-containing protein [Brevibacillus brevis]|uniref:helix-turn-helix domain-containing protein n=1 Tax=Brevibacillus brevis TaxID=1393 RepID=UPI0037C562E0